MRLDNASDKIDLPCIDIIKDILAFDDIGDSDGGCTRNGIPCIGTALQTTVNRHQATPEGMTNQRSWFQFICQFSAADNTTQRESVGKSL
jgi:hypothetical protein